MHLSNIGLVQWHLFPLLDIPVAGPVIGIAGENKSGKSTILDAIQAVMTGGDQKAMNLNRAAAEGTRGAHRRTLLAYCLGRLSRDDTMRDVSSTTVILAFRDPFGLRPPVSIGVSIEAEKASNAATVVSRFIVRGVEIKASDIVRDDDGVPVVEPWRDCRRRLEAAVSARGGTFTDYRDGARDFVREYIFALFEKGRSAVPGQFVRSFVNAIAFREMDSANDFVRNYLLEEEPIQIGSLRRSIKVYRDADKQVKELNAQLQQLLALQAKLDELEQLDDRKQREAWIALRARVVAAVHHHNTINRRYKNTVTNVRLEEARQEACEKEIDEIKAEIGRIDRDRGAALSEDRQAALKKDIQLIDRELSDLRRPVSGPGGLAAIMQELAQLRPLVDVANADVATFDLVDEARKLLPGAGDPSLPKDAERLDEILANLRREVPAVGQLLRRKLEGLRAEHSDITKTERELIKHLEVAGRGRAILARTTEDMIDRLTREGMAPKVLAELAEIPDERWADAAEGYLGIDRETIFVAPDDSRRATEILGRERSQFRRVRIANTRKIASMDSRAQAGSLASVFKTDDRLAQAFLVFRTGGIRLAQTRADLDRPGRWIMDDGTYDDGAIIDVKEPQDGRKLGAKAIAASAERLRVELARTSEQAKHLKAGVDLAQRWERTVERFVSLTSQEDDALQSIVELDRKARALLVSVDEIRHVIASLAAADVSVFDEQLSHMRTNLNEALDEHSKRKGRLEKLYESRGSDRDTLGAGHDRPGSRFHAHNAMSRYRQNRRTLAVVEPIAAYRVRRAQHKTALALAESAEAETASASEESRELRSECEVAGRACLAALNQSDLFGLRPSLFGEIRPWANERIEEIRGETLVEYEAELADARRKTNDIFRNSFANELAARFAKVDAELRDIRDVLRKYDFLDERYSFRSARAPGYEAFHAIVDRLREVELSDVQLFHGDVQDDHPLATELRAVEAVLLADDVDIEIYEDYRRYFSFELEITSSNGRTVPWSERKGTASGGETQTPYYVALLSALSSMYYGGARSRLGGNATGLCLAAFDEAFSKLDETVRYAMVSFCLELGLQLLICGPDGGRQSMERYAHTIVDVWRRGDESYARSDLIKQRTRDELAAIDPARLSRTDVQALMTEAAPT